MSTRSDLAVNRAQQRLGPRQEGKENQWPAPDRLSRNQQDGISTAGGAAISEQNTHFIERGPLPCAERSVAESALKRRRAQMQPGQKRFTPSSKRDAEGTIAVIEEPTGGCPCAR